MMIQVFWHQSLSS